MGYIWDRKEQDALGKAFLEGGLNAYLAALNASTPAPTTPAVVESPLSSVSSSPVDTGPVDTGEPYPGYFAQQEARAQSQSQISQNQQGFTDYQKSLSTPASSTPDPNQTPYSPLQTVEQPIDWTAPSTPVQSPAVVEKPVIKAEPTSAEIAQEMSVGITPVDFRYDVDKDGKVTAADALMLAQGTPLRSALDLLKEAGSSLVTPPLTPTADVTTTPSGQGDLPATGSAALKTAVAPGGIGVEEFDRRIREYLDGSPTEAEAYKRMLDLKASKEDIERATGKSYEQIFPETFKPGSVLSSGFGDVTKQLGGEGYYKGVAIPTFYEQSLGDAGSLSVADQLATWKANIDKQDLSVSAPFGFVETPVYTQPTGDYDPYISGYQATPATALDYLTQNNPVIANAVFGHTSTAANAYKIVNGELKEVGHDEITPEDLAEGNAFFMLAGKTGGPDRERMAQLYRAEGDELIPVGDPKMYKGAKEQDMGLAFLDMAASALSFVPGPWQIPAVAYKAVRGAMEGDWTGVAKAFLPPVVATAVSVYEAFDSKDPFKIATALMGTDVLPELGSFDLGAGVTVKDAVLAAKAVEAINNGQWDVAAIIGGQLSGSSELTAAGQGLRIKNAIEKGDFSGAITAAQGLSKTVDQLAKAPPNLLDEIKFKEANASPLGVGALSPNPTEDEQIRIQQRQNAANQALTDYMGSGNDLSREGLVSQLQSLGLSADQAEGYAKQADQQINMNRVGSDVMNRYSKIDPEFGTPQLDRQTAIGEMMAAGMSSERANNLLNGIDAQNAIKLENKLSIQSAYSNFTSGKGTEEQLRSALTSAGYTDAEINNLVTRGNAIIEGGKLTAGESAQERAANLPDIRAEIAGKSNFNDAYALAREKLGPGATFTWQGKDYVASSATERPDLTGATKTTTSTAVTDTPYVAPNGMHNRAAFIQAGGGTSDADYAKYVQAVNAVIAEGKSGTLITPASVNSTGKEMPSTTGPVTMEKPRVDSVLGSVAAQGVASFGANSIAGALSALGFTDAGKTVLDKANQIAAAATAAEGADITKGKADINAAIQKVGQSSGIKDFAANIGNLASTAFNNPKAFGATVGSEAVEELLQLATLKFPASFLVKETVASALENGGAAYNTEYESQIAKGASKEDAHQAAQKAAGTAAGISVALGGAAAGLGKVAGKVIGSQADEVPTSAVGQVGKTTIKESAQEVVEEGSIAASIDLALGRPVNAVNVLTNMTGGALYGGPTSGVMQGTKLDTLDQTPSTSIGSGISSQLTNDLNSSVDLTTSINNAVSNNITADLGGTIDSTIKAVVDNGADLSQGVADLTSSAVSNTGDTTIVINNVVSSLASNGADLNANAGSIVAGAVSGGATVTDAVDTTLKAVTANGGNVADAAASIITSVSASGDTAQVANATTAVVNAAITSGSNVTATTSNAVDAALAASGGSTDVVTQVVGGVASKGNNDATAAAVASAVTNTGNTTAAVDAALSSGGDAGTVLSTASNAAIASGADAGSVVSDTITAALGNQVGGKVAVDSAVKGALDAGADTTVVVGSAVKSGLEAGLSTGTVVSGAVSSAVSGGSDSTIVIDSALSTVAQSGGDVSQAAGSAVTASLGAGANANETIIAATSSAIKNGGDAGSAVTTVIAGAVQGGASLSDASASSVATAIVGGANADTVIKAVTDSNSGVSVKADTGNNVTTVVASDATSNTKVVMDSNSQSVVTTTTDTNTGTTTQTTMQGNTTITTTTDQNTGISTTTKVDPNITTNTTTDTNTGITTQVTTNTNTNTNSTTTVNTNTNTTTNTTTNNNTNTTTNTSVNTDTGDAVITVVDDKTGEVIDTKVTTIDQLPVDVKDTLTVDPVTVTPDKTTTTKATTAKAPTISAPKTATAGAGMSLVGDIGRLPGTMLKTAGDPTLKDPLAALSQKVEEMNQIDPALMAIMAQRLGMQMPQVQQEPTFTYGQETSIDDILGLREPKEPEERQEEMVFAEGGFVEPLRAKAMNPQFMNHGGALPGGRENFKHGKHVAGEGDGQSDDIPAWLADGEFVFPADVVSALGNGSTKAGTDKLYKMMHEIRARARSTKVKDLPPPAHKSPLDYLKRGK
jgi:hypothetical protein